jgi:hypothetical protein
LRFYEKKQNKISETLLLKLSNKPLFSFASAGGPRAS